MLSIHTLKLVNSSLHEHKFIGTHLQKLESTAQSVLQLVTPLSSINYFKTISSREWLFDDSLLWKIQLCVYTDGGSTGHEAKQIFNSTADVKPTSLEKS